MPLLPLRHFPTVLRRTLLAPLAAVVVLALTTAGCGSSDPVAVAADAPVQIAMSEFRLDPQDLRVEAGRRTFDISNEGTMVHRFELRSADGRRRLTIGSPLRPGESQEITLDLAPGSYLIRCAQDRHNTLGEHGTLQVS